jgi:ubiquinone/menaquinone biosynthesis C-methylase UbiE
MAKKRKKQTAARKVVKQKGTKKKSSRNKFPRKKKLPVKYKSYLKDKKTKLLYKSVIEEYTTIARIYDDRWKDYLAATEGALLKQLKLKGKETILDAGCGTGSLVCAIQEKFKHKGKIMGFDVTPAMLDLAELKVTRKKFNKNLSLELGHCENFSAKSGSVDIAICSSVFHHLPHPEHALDEFRRVLKKNGRLLLLDFCTDFPVTKVLDGLSKVFHRAHHMAYGSTEMRSLLKKHGFKVTSLKKFKASPMIGVMLFEAKKK